LQRIYAVNRVKLYPLLKSLWLQLQKANLKKRGVFSPTEKAKAALDLKRTRQKIHRAESYKKAQPTPFWLLREHRTPHKSLSCCWATTTHTTRPWLRCCIRATPMSQAAQGLRAAPRCLQGASSVRAQPLRCDLRCFQRAPGAWPGQPSGQALPPPSPSGEVPPAQGSDGVGQLAELGLGDRCQEQDESRPAETIFRPHRIMSNYVSTLPSEKKKKKTKRIGNRQLGSWRARKMFTLLSNFPQHKPTDHGVSCYLSLFLPCTLLKSDRLYNKTEGNRSPRAAAKRSECPKLVNYTTPTSP